MSGCSDCSGCRRCNELILHPSQIAILKKLCQIPFLPVAKNSNSDQPIYLEDDSYSTEEYSTTLLCLEKQGLISLDYDLPLKGCDLSAYAAYDQCGSFALTAKGQTVAQQLELLGAEEA